MDLLLMDLLLMDLLLVDLLLVDLLLLELLLLLSLLLLKLRRCLREKWIVASMLRCQGLRSRLRVCHATLKAHVLILLRN
jgi:hypothetical protein